MEDITDLPNKPKTAPPLVKERNDAVNQSHDEKSTPTPAYHHRAGPASPHRISSEPNRGTALPRVDVSETPMRDGEENEGGSMMRHPPRLFAATPDSERPSVVVMVDEKPSEDLNVVPEGAARHDRPVMGVPDIIVESVTTTINGLTDNVEEKEGLEENHDEGDDEEEMEDKNIQRKLWGNMGKPIERVASPMRPRPSSPIPGKGRKAQIPFMAYVVGAAVEKNKLDETLGPEPSLYEQPLPQQPSPQYSSLLTPNDKHASKMSLVAEIMRTDSYGNKLLQRAPSTTGRYQPIGTHANDFSLLRPCEMNTYAESQSRLDMQRSASHIAKDTDITKDDGVQETKETDEEEKNTKALKVLGKLMGKLSADSGPSTTEEKKPAAADGADSNQSGGLASTAGVLTSMIRWKTKKKLNIGKETHEKYPGYIDMFNRQSRDLMTSVPFPILLQTRREAFPIIQSIAKAYKSTLGPHHQMTEEAFAKVEKLRSELQDHDVFL